MKKRLFSIFLCLVLVLGLAACGNSDTSQTNAQENDKKRAGCFTGRTEPEGTDDSESEAEQASAGKALVVYFSVPETDSAEDMNAEEENKF